MSPEVENLMRGLTLIENALGLAQPPPAPPPLPDTPTVFNSTGPHACTNDTGCGMNPCVCRTLLCDNCGEEVIEGVCGCRCRHCGKPAAAGVCDPCLDKYEKE